MSLFASLHIYASRDVMIYPEFDYLLLSKMSCVSIADPPLRSFMLSGRTPLYKSSRGMMMLTTSAWRVLERATTVEAH